MGEGTVNDEELVEVIARGFRDGGFPGRYPEDIASTALAALRSAGFQVFKPDECDELWVEPELKDGSGRCSFGYVPSGAYFLVPYDGGSG